jgi:hypothetical protein
MPRVYELPTHLGVEDHLIAALTAPQLLRLAIGASVGYAVWDQLRWIPGEPRLVLAVVVTIVGGVFAVVRPVGRSLDQWLLAWVQFLLLPHRLAWRPGNVLSRQTPLDRTEWAELELRPEWHGVATSLGDSGTKGPRGGLRALFRGGRTHDF